MHSCASTYQKPSPQIPGTPATSMPVPGTGRIPVPGPNSDTQNSTSTQAIRDAFLNCTLVCPPSDPGPRPRASAGAWQHPTLPVAQVQALRRWMLELLCCGTDPPHQKQNKSIYRNIRRQTITPTHAERTPATRNEKCDLHL